MNKEQAFRQWYEYNYSWFIQRFADNEIDDEIKFHMDTVKEHDQRVWDAAIEWYKEHQTKIDKIVQEHLNNG